MARSEIEPLRARIAQMDQELRLMLASKDSRMELLFDCQAFTFTTRPFVIRGKSAGVRRKTALGVPAAAQILLN